MKKMFRLPGFTVGIKILIGVSLASNLFIGLLVYTNLKSAEKLTTKVNEVLSIREQLSSNLRTAIVNLQNDFLTLPEFFKTNPQDNIIRVIEGSYPAASRKSYKGRDSYKGLFTRKERRDISKQKFIVQHRPQGPFVSWGLFDSDNSFTDEVVELRLESSSPEQDVQKVQSIINDMTGEKGKASVLQARVNELSGKVADAGLEAEQTRNEILEYVEHIGSLEHELESTRSQQRQQTVLTAAIAIMANMIVLFFLVRWIVEKPLYKLTDTINAIRAGEEINIPYGSRKDQIGVLSGTIANFREALSQITTENNRRQHEKVIVEQMADDMATIINSLEKRATELVSTAVSLENLATTTKSQSENVTHKANITAQHTDNVSLSTNRLQSAFTNINTQMQGQKRVLETLLTKNVKSQHHTKNLTDSVQDIHSIINTVSDITDQTKLLALNATIEAARAGSAGKGFGVVASEVKDLSYKTEQATKDVMSRVDGIEKAVSVLVSNLTSINEGIEDLNSITITISSALGEQQGETENISNLASQTSDNTRSVSTSIVEVSDAASETRDLAAQVHSFSGQIADQLASLLRSTTTKLSQLTNQ